MCEVEKHVAMNNLCRTTRKSLAHPYCAQASSDTVPPKPFVETFADLGEEPTIGIVANIRSDPMDRGMSVQRRANSRAKLTAAIMFDA